MIVTERNERVHGFNVGRRRGPLRVSDWAEESRHGVTNRGVFQCLTQNVHHSEVVRTVPPPVLSGHPRCHACGDCAPAPAPAPENACAMAAAFRLRRIRDPGQSQRLWTGSEDGWSESSSVLRSRMTTVSDQDTSNSTEGADGSRNNHHRAESHRADDAGRKAA